MPRRAATFAADGMDGSAEVAAAAEPARSFGSAAPLRESILGYIKAQIGGAGEVVLSAKAIAQAIGAKAETVTYHLAHLVKDGQLVTRSAGPKGTRFRLGTGTPALVVARQTRGRKAHDATASAAPLNFCPYCGEKVAAPAWRFCGYCGEKLAR